MTDPVFVQGDTAPDITGTIHDAEDATIPIDLTGCTVKFMMRPVDGKRYTVNSAAVIVDPPAGTVKYSWATNDLSVPGEYLVEWEVTYPDAKIQTTVSLSTITVRRQ